MRVRVREVAHGYSRGRRWADWEAACSCGESLEAEEWQQVMEFALGHLSLGRHNQS